MAGAPRIAFYSPTLEQTKEGILVPDKDMISLYDTLHNDLLVNLPTPNHVAPDEPRKTLSTCDTYHTYSTRFHTHSDVCSTTHISLSAQLPTIRHAST